MNRPTIKPTDLIPDCFTRPGWTFFNAEGACGGGVLMPCGKVYAHGYDGVLNLSGVKPASRNRLARAFIVANARS